MLMIVVEFAVILTECEQQCPSNKPPAALLQRAGETKYQYLVSFDHDVNVGNTFSSFTLEEGC